MNRVARWVTGIAGVLILGIVALTFFAGGAANLNCDEIAREAQRISQGQPVQIRDITNVQETSRTLGRGSGEGRCSGQAQLSDGTTSAIYMRAFEQDGNLMVEYSPTEFQQ